MSQVASDSQRRAVNVGYRPGVVSDSIDAAGRYSMDSFSSAHRLHQQPQAQAPIAASAMAPRTNLSNGGLPHGAGNGKAYPASAPQPHRTAGPGHSNENSHDNDVNVSLTQDLAAAHATNTANGPVKGSQNASVLSQPSHMPHPPRGGVSPRRHNGNDGGGGADLPASAVRNSITVLGVSQDSAQWRGAKQQQQSTPRGSRVNGATPAQTMGTQRNGSVAGSQPNSAHRQPQQLATPKANPRAAQPAAAGGGGPTSVLVHHPSPSASAGNRQTQQQQQWRPPAAAMDRDSSSSSRGGIPSMDPRQFRATPKRQQQQQQRPEPAQHHPSQIAAADHQLVPLGLPQHRQQQRGAHSSNQMVPSAAPHPQPQPQQQQQPIALPRTKPVMHYQARPNGNGTERGDGAMFVSTTTLTKAQRKVRYVGVQEDYDPTAPDEEEEGEDRVGLTPTEEAALRDPAQYAKLVEAAANQHPTLLLRDSGEGGATSGSGNNPAPTYLLNDGYRWVRKTNRTPAVSTRDPAGKIPAAPVSGKATERRDSREYEPFAALRTTSGGDTRGSGGGGGGGEYLVQRHKQQLVLGKDLLQSASPQYLPPRAARAKRAWPSENKSKGSVSSRQAPPPHQQQYQLPQQPPQPALADRVYHEAIAKSSGQQPQQQQRLAPPQLPATSSPHQLLDAPAVHQVLRSPSHGNASYQQPPSHPQTPDQRQQQQQQQRPYQRQYPTSAEPTPLHGSKGHDADRQQHPYRKQQPPARALSQPSINAGPYPPNSQPITYYNQSNGDTRTQNAGADVRAGGSGSDSHYRDDVTPHLYGSHGHPPIPAMPQGETQGPYSQYNSYHPSTSVPQRPAVVPPTLRDPTPSPSSSARPTPLRNRGPPPQQQQQQQPQPHRTGTTPNASSMPSSRHTPMPVAQPHRETVAAITPHPPPRQPQSADEQEPEDDAHASVEDGQLAPVDGEPPRQQQQQQRPAPVEEIEYEDDDEEDDEEYEEGEEVGVGVGEEGYPSVSSGPTDPSHAASAYAAAIASLERDDPENPALLSARQPHQLPTQRDPSSQPTSETVQRPLFNHHHPHPHHQAADAEGEGGEEEEADNGSGQPGAQEEQLYPTEAEWQGGMGEDITISEEEDEEGEGGVGEYPTEEPPQQQQQQLQEEGEHLPSDLGVVGGVAPPPPPPPPPQASIHDETAVSHVPYSNAKAHHPSSSSSAHPHRQQLQLQEEEEEEEGEVASSQDTNTQPVPVEVRSEGDEEEDYSDFDGDFEEPVKIRPTQLVIDGEVYELPRHNDDGGGGHDQGDVVAHGGGDDMNADVVDASGSHRSRNHEVGIPLFSTDDVGYYRRNAEDEDGTVPVAEPGVPAPSAFVANARGAAEADAVMAGSVDPYHEIGEVAGDETTVTTYVSRPQPTAGDTNPPESAGEDEHDARSAPSHASDVRIGSSRYPVEEEAHEAADDGGSDNPSLREL